MAFKDDLSNLYKLSVLDCVVEAAYVVAKDFSNRPELYQTVGVAEELTKLQSLIGVHPDVPNKSIRTALYKPIFGGIETIPSNSEASVFKTTRQAIVDAAADYSENAGPEGFEMLKERVKSALLPFKNHLSDLEGKAFEQSCKRLQAIFDLAVLILKDKNVHTVFGIDGDRLSKDADWPLSSKEPQGAKLIEKISSQLGDTASGISRDKFIRLQRIAEMGSKAIQGAVDFPPAKGSEDDAIKKIITSMYAWGSDLGLLKK